MGGMVYSNEEEMGSGSSNNGTSALSTVVSYVVEELESGLVP